jgi:hypothetical protein
MIAEPREACRERRRFERETVATEPMRPDDAVVSGLNRACRISFGSIAGPVLGGEEGAKSPIVTRASLRYAPRCAIGNLGSV